MSKKKTETPEEVIDRLETQLKQLDTVELAAQTMLGDLMSLCVEQAKAMPRSWQEMSESEQDDYLYRIEAQCRMAVTQCVQIIASEGFVRIPVTIKSTTIKDAVVVQAELVSNHQVIDLVSAETKIAMLVLADSSAFTRDEGKPKAQADQRSLELGDEYKDGVAA